MLIVLLVVYIAIPVILIVLLAVYIAIPAILIYYLQFILL